MRCRCSYRCVSCDVRTLSSRAPPRPCLLACPLRFEHSIRAFESSTSSELNHSRAKHCRRTFIAFASEAATGRRSSRMKEGVECAASYLFFISTEVNRRSLPRPCSALSHGAGHVVAVRVRLNYQPGEFQKLRKCFVPSRNE